MPPYNTASLVRPIAAGSSLATGRDRAATPAAAHPGRVDAELVQLVQRRLDHAGRDLHRAADRGRAARSGTSPLAPGPRSAAQPCRRSPVAAPACTPGTGPPGRPARFQASSSNRSSTRASARPGPLAIAKKSPCSSFQPAYCAAKHAAAGSSTATATPGQVRSPTDTPHRVDPAQAAHARGREAQAGLQPATGLGAAVDQTRARVQACEPRSQARRRPQAARRRARRHARSSTGSYPSLRVEHQDLAASELGPVARPARPGSVEQRVGDASARASRTRSNCNRSAGGR